MKKLLAILLLTSISFSSFAGCFSWGTLNVNRLVIYNGGIHSKYYLELVPSNSDYLTQKKKEYLEPTFSDVKLNQ